MTWDCQIPPCEIPEEEGRATGLARFEARFNVRLAGRQLSAMARQGVFTADLTYPMHVPYAVRAQEALRDLFSRRSKLAPLCVTAWVPQQEQPADMPEEYMCWFRHLSRLKALPLLCFAEGAMAKRVSLVHPNMLDYKNRYGLQARGCARWQGTKTYARLSKAFLLAQAREKFLHHTHYIWMDFSYQRYPVYERTAFDWGNICQDKITLATVEGMPDLSMIAVPDGRVLTLCRELTALCEQYLQEEGRLPEEEEIWLRMMVEHPDWFSTVEMPGRRELFTMTMMSREEEAHAYT